MYKSSVSEWAVSKSEVASPVAESIDFLTVVPIIAVSVSAVSWWEVGKTTGSAVSVSAVSASKFSWSGSLVPRLSVFVSAVFESVVFWWEVGKMAGSDSVD